jgi:hypothetical protein
MWLAVTCILALLPASFASAAEVDWKMYGFVPGKSAYCFYDANSVTHTADKHLRVWAKCLLERELEDVDIKSPLGGKIVENAGRKVANTYVPPYTLVENIDFDQAIRIIQYEETANLSDIQPSGRFFYELNCPERMMRTLDTYVRESGKDGFSHEATAWQHVPPEGGGAALVKILCR